MTGLLQCDDLMQFQRLLEEKCLIQYFWCFVWFQGIEAAEGDRRQDNICSQCEHSNRIHAGGQLYWCTFQYFHFASILSGSRSWSETKMLGIENWARTKLQGLYSDWLHWLIALPPGQRRTYSELCLCHGRQGENNPGKDALALVGISYFSRSNVSLFFFPRIVLFFVLQVKEKSRDRAELRQDQVKVSFYIL